MDDAQDRNDTRRLYGVVAGQEGSGAWDRTVNSGQRALQTFSRTMSSAPAERTRDIGHHRLNVQVNLPWGTKKARIGSESVWGAERPGVLTPFSLPLGETR